MEKQCNPTALIYNTLITTGITMLDSLVARIAPHDCLNCGTEGYLICPSCRGQLQKVPERCYRCKKLSSGSRTCGSCQSSSQLYSVQVATVYQGVAKDLVWRLKFHGARAAVKEMASLLYAMVPQDEGLLVVHVPTATKRV